VRTFLEPEEGCIVMLRGRVHDDLGGAVAAEAAACVHVCMCVLTPVAFTMSAEPVVIDYGCCFENATRL